MPYALTFPISKYLCLPSGSWILVRPYTYLIVMLSEVQGWIFKITLTRCCELYSKAAVTCKDLLAVRLGRKERTHLTRLPNLGASHQEDWRHSLQLSLAFGEEEDQMILIITHIDIIEATHQPLVRRTTAGGFPMRRWSILGPPFWADTESLIEFRPLSIITSVNWLYIQ
jgi:hypothetical protein